MSTLTIKLNKEERIMMDKIQRHLGVKTSAGSIRVMIQRFIELDEENKRRMWRIETLEHEYKELEKKGQDYFNSMHELMKACEFKSKL